VTPFTVGKISVAESPDVVMACVAAGRVTGGLSVPVDERQRYLFSLSGTGSNVMTLIARNALGRAVIGMTENGPERVSG
jgi:hypothetical protein